MNRGHASDSCLESFSTSDANTLTSDNIPYDAIDMILCYLRMEDLANVADTSKRLREIAGLVFARTYANNHVTLIDETLNTNKPGFIDPIYRLPKQVKEFKTKHVISFGIDNCLGLLRNFGKYIKFIRIRFDQKKIKDTESINQRSWMYVNGYISEYCADSLEILEMSGNPMFVLQKPMTKLHKFCEFQFHSYNYRALLAMMPNLQTLISNLKIQPEEVEHMPHLKDLVVTVKEDEDFCIFHRLLQMNRQITKVTIETLAQISIDMILFSICENLTQLNNLKITVTGLRPTVIINNRFETVEKFSLTLFGASDLMKNFSSFHFNNLRKLRLSDLDYDETFFQMLSRNKKLKSFKLRKPIRPAVVKILPKLLKEWKDLDEISVVISHKKAESELLKCLGSGWKIVEKLPDRLFTDLCKIKYQRLK